MLDRDLELLLLSVARDVNDLQPVQKRMGHLVCTVGSANEEHLREIVGQSHIVVDERAVLGRVQNLK